MADKNEMAQKLLNWIKEQANEDYICEFYENESCIGLNLQSEYAKGQVNVVFLQSAVVEYRITNDHEENVFYLHFELNDLDHSKELFNEMKECLLRQKKTETKQILLCCSCGLTTSYFMMKLNEAAKVLGEKMEFSAVPYDILYDNAKDKDAVLIAPQIGYQLKNAKKILKDKIVMEVPVQIFSSYDAAGMITMLKEAFNVAKTPVRTEQKPDIQEIERNQGSVLIVSVVDMEGRNQIAYRLYDKGEIKAENQITKEKYYLSDILDTIQVVALLNPDLEKICLVTPGTIHEGKLTYEKANIRDVDVCGFIRKQVGKDVSLFSDADMIALGYARKERNCEDTIFYFVPTGSYTANIGLFLNGSLVRSSSFVGGTELEWITKITTFPQNPFALVRTPEGNVELAARYITGLYSYTGVRHIAFYSSMIPDQADILKKMGEFIPEKYLPEIVKVNSVRDYLYEGALYSI